MTMWQRGADNLHFVRNAMRRSHPQYDWQQLSLIGHSNGGDMSAWLLKSAPTFASTLITLDHRRVPLPHSSLTRILSIRASDVAADPGVLPMPQVQQMEGVCVVKIAGARHNDMNDSGPLALKDTMRRLIRQFLLGGKCMQDVPEFVIEPGNR